MPDAQQLAHLIALIDDESPEIRDPVFAELAAFGTTLEAELCRVCPHLSGEQRRSVVDAVSNWSRTAGGGSMFVAGDLVEHVSYGYRGVVVAVDPTCLADIDWYLRNRTQPDRDQPWYHVLVDGADTVTYAAQSSLTNGTPGEVLHPLVPYFFDRDEVDRYIRNDRPWPGGDAGNDI